MYTPYYATATLSSTIFRFLPNRLPPAISINRVMM